MRKSLLNLLGVAALTMSTCVYAVGMGGINVASALGQPLKADIELVAISKAERNNLVARLASPDVYKGAGLDYPHNNKFKFQIENRAEGGAFLKVSSEQPINDPFVSILVELTWPSGRLLREYTFLLDPPGYTPEQPVMADVQTVAPGVQPAPAEVLVKPVEKATPTVAVEKPVAKPVAKPVVAAPARQAAVEPAAMNVASGSITVQRGDSLSKIAAQNKPAEVSLDRMLVALYRANADQFDGKNMNRIKTGRILRLPDQNELMNVTQSDAAHEIRTQATDWNAYRQKLASAAATSSQPQVAKQVATGKITSSVTDKAPVAKETAKEVLKLSKGETPGDKTVAAGATGKAMTAQEKKNAAQEDAIAKAKAIKEEQTRAALLEKNLQDMQRLAKLKADAAAQMHPASAAAPVASRVAATSGVVAASGVSAASGVVAASGVAAVSGVSAASAAQPAPVAKPKPKVAPKPVAEPPGLVEQVLDEPLYMAGGLAALLGLVGLGFMRKRRKSVAAGTAIRNNEDAGEITSHIAMPVAPSPDTGDFTVSTAAVTGAEEAVLSDDVDPISEADLFLNFGRDAQAEEILKDALQKTPDNHQIHLKLLGIYASRKEVNTFAVIACQLKDSGDEAAWQQAAAMGRKLDPSNPEYNTGTIEDTGSATMQTTVFQASPDFVIDDALMEQKTPAPDVDFDLGEPLAGVAPEQDAMVDAGKTMVLTPADMAEIQPETLDVKEAADNLSGPTVMDFDVTSTDSLLDASTEMDFDITATNPAAPAITEPSAVAAQAESELSNLDDLIFDVTSTHAEQPAVQAADSEPAETAQAEGDGMEFTLDFPVEEVIEKPATAVKPAEPDFADIDLNFDDIAKPDEAAPESRSEHWHEVATKLDLAKAYQEMGDATGAREILEEVLHEGDAEQCEAAHAMLAQLG